MEKEDNFNATTYNLTSDYGIISPNFIGHPQPQMSEVLKSFFNDFIKHCSKHEITRFSLPVARVEFIDGRTDRSQSHPLDGRPFQFLLQDILAERSEVVHADLIITGRIATNFHFDIKFKNGEKIYEEIGCILVPPSDGRMRFIIEIRRI